MDRLNIYSTLKKPLGIFNKLVIVPDFKMSLGRIISYPLPGQIMAPKIKGRKTGRILYDPVSYASVDGMIYCYQGTHMKCVWYLDLKANPNVEVILPDDRTFQGIAEEVADTAREDQSHKADH